MGPLRRNDAPSAHELLNHRSMTSARRDSPDAAAPGAVADWDREAFDAGTQSGVALVEFHVRWAVQSAAQLAEYAPLAVRMGDRVQFGRVDVQRQAELVAENRILSVPTFVLFKNGEEFGRLVGLQPADVLERWITALL